MARLKSQSVMSNLRSQKVTSRPAGIRDLQKTPPARHAQFKWQHLPGIKVGETNLEKVRKFFKTHLCATQVECAEALGLSTMAVSRHVRTLRSEWKRTLETTH